MKNFYLTLMLLMLSAASYAATITAIASGTWNVVGTWDLNRVPAAGDVIVIPAGYTVTIINNNNFSAAATQVNIYGNMVLSGGKLSLASGSIVQVFTGGTLSGTGCNCETLSINGNQKFNGTQATINGPAQANDASTGFVAFTPLPVKFTSYSVVKNGTDYQVSWTTSEEVNSAYYEVERSVDGKSWKAVARIAAAGNTSSVRSYSYNDRNVIYSTVYYRVKQADVDGRTAYTTVKTFRNTQSAPVYITSSAGQVHIRFGEATSSPVNVELINLSGQTLSTRSFSGSNVLTMPVSGSLKGQYVVRVRYDNTGTITRQVIL